MEVPPKRRTTSLLLPSAPEIPAAMMRIPWSSLYNPSASSVNDIRSSTPAPTLPTAVVERFQTPEWAARPLPWPTMNCRHFVKGICHLLVTTGRGAEPPRSVSLLRAVRTLHLDVGALLAFTTRCVTVWGLIHTGARGSLLDAHLTLSINLW